MPFTCGSHRAFVYELGGVVPVGELTPLSKARWRRIRDDISDAYVEVPTHECCELLGDLRTIKHELHLERNGEIVWQGPITRLEYDYNTVGVYATDVLWYATRTVIRTGYDFSHPAIANVIDQMDWLLRVQVYRPSDPFQVLPHLHPIHQADPADDPQTHRVVERYQYYAWEDFDKYAEDYGADYTVVNRDIYYWDTHLAWKIIPPLDDTYMSQFPRVVEYGNQLANRGYVTNGQGYAGIYTKADRDGYPIVDLLITNQNDGQADGVPTSEEIAGWTDTARRNIDGAQPSPTAVVIPANTTLLPGSPWNIADLVPGAWFEVSVTRMCRQVSEWQRLHEITVTEEGPTGEQVAFTAIAAPATMIIPP